MGVRPGLGQSLGDSRIGFTILETYLRFCFLRCRILVPAPKYDTSVFTFLGESRQFRMVSQRKSGEAGDVDDTPTLVLTPRSGRRSSQEIWILLWGVSTIV